LGHSSTTFNIETGSFHRDGNVLVSDRLFPEALRLGGQITNVHFRDIADGRSAVTPSPFRYQQGPRSNAANDGREKSSSACQRPTDQAATEGHLAR
jgi:hypothetical protein